METEAHAVISKAHRELRCEQPFLLDHTIGNSYKVLFILSLKLKTTCILQIQCYLIFLICSSYNYYKTLLSLIILLEVNIKQNIQIWVGEMAQWVKKARYRVLSWSPR